MNRFWSEGPAPTVDYHRVDATTLRRFTGAHPHIVQDWLSKAEGLLQPDPNHRLTARKKNLRMMKLKKWFGLQFNKKHNQLVR